MIHNAQSPYSLDVSRDYIAIHGAEMLDDMKSQAYLYTLITSKEALESLENIYMDEIYAWDCRAMVILGRPVSTVSKPSVPGLFRLSISSFCLMPVSVRPVGYALLIPCFPKAVYLAGGKSDHGCPARTLWYWCRIRVRARNVFPTLGYRLKHSSDLFYSFSCCPRAIHCNAPLAHKTWSTVAARKVLGGVVDCKTDQKSFTVSKNSTVQHTSGPEGKFCWATASRPLNFCFPCAKHSCSEKTTTPICPFRLAWRFFDLFRPVLNYAKALEMDYAVIFLQTRKPRTFHETCLRPISCKLQASLLPICFTLISMILLIQPDVHNLFEVQSQQKGRSHDLDVTNLDEYTYLHPAPRTRKYW